MPSNINMVHQEIAKALRELNSYVYEELHACLENTLDMLLRKEIIRFGPDYTLRGKSLELRVGLVFEELGFDVSCPRRGMEDFVVRNLHGESGLPVVVEVKSKEKDANPKLDDLRQLDDYVFELSGERAIRLAGLTRQPPKKGGTTIRPFACWVDDSPPKHPTPHKGLFIFNGPWTQPFELRPKENWVGINAREFAEKRGFCLLSFQALLAWHAECLRKTDAKAEFWHQICTTVGVLKEP
jgi:hypothetical protein